MHHAHRAVELAADKQASDIVLLDVRESSTFADFFVLLTSDNPRHMRALIDDLDQGLSAQGANLLRVEGTVESGWILMDFGDLLVHVFASEERTYYRLEEIWGRSLPLVRIQ